MRLDIKCSSPLQAGVFYYNLHAILIDWSFLLQEGRVERLFLRQPPDPENLF